MAGVHKITDGPWIVTRDDGATIEIPDGTPIEEKEAIQLAFLGPRVDRWLIPKSVVWERVMWAGKLPNAIAALEADQVLKSMWYMPGWAEVWSDDPYIVPFLQSLGVDVEAVLARP